MVKVLSVDSGKVQLQVIRALLGAHKPGAKIDAEGEASRYFSQSVIGKEFIYLNLHAFGAAFPVLSLDLEDEVKFLIAGTVEVEIPEGRRVKLEDGSDGPSTRRVIGDLNALVKDLPEAVKCIQGISTATRDAGLAYVKAHPEGAAPAIIKALDELRTEILKTDDLYYPTYRARSLTLALAALKDPASAAWFEAQINLFLKANAVKADYANAEEANGEAILLKDALSASAENKELAARLKESLCAATPKLDPLHAAEAVFALGMSALLNDEDVLNLATRIGDKNGVALGCFWIAREEDRWWQWDSAKLWLVHANFLAKEPALKEQIDKLSKWLHRDE